MSGKGHRRRSAPRPAPVKRHARVRQTRVEHEAAARLNQWKNGGSQVDRAVWVGVLDPVEPVMGVGTVSPIQP